MLTSIILQAFSFLSNPCNLQTKGVFIYWTALGLSFLLPRVINLTRQQQLLFNLSKLVCQRQSVWRSYPRSILIIPMNHLALYETEQLNSWHRMSQALNAASICSCKQQAQGHFPSECLYSCSTSALLALTSFRSYQHILFFLNYFPWEKHDTNLGMLFAIPTNGYVLHSEKKIRKNLGASDTRENLLM